MVDVATTVTTKLTSDVIITLRNNTRYIFRMNNIKINYYLIFHINIPLTNRAR